MHDEMKKVFSKKFAMDQIIISDDELYLGNKKYVPTKDWKLNWIIDRNERGIYIEYYAIHNRGGHLHERIYSDGIEESLDVLKQYIVYSPNTPGDRKRSLEELESHNRNLMQELKQKGLL